MFAIEMFNEKAGAVGFDDALAKLKCIPDNANNELLNTCYRAYKETYDKIVSQVIQKRSDYSQRKAFVLERIDSLADSLQCNARSLSRVPEELG
eukprot:195892-Hanusia_phi.AAC.1